MSEAKMITTNMDQVLPFIQAILGAHSITLGTLGSYRRPISADTGPDRDMKADLREIQVLCRNLGRDISGTEYLKALFDLFDQFVAQGRQVSPDQRRQAEQLSRAYIDWIFATFPARIKRAIP